MKYRICEGCKIPHFENCRTCVGWGFRDVSPTDARKIIVSTSEALSGLALAPTAGSFDSPSVAIVNPTACPECGSTIKGLPTELTTT